MARTRVLLSHLADKIVLDGGPGLSGIQLMLRSRDLQPVPASQRRWTGRHFVSFWVADAINISNWMVASSMVVAGLSWWQAWLAVWLGYGITALFVTLTGRIGAVYHVSFPVLGRASFGIWGNYWPVLNRVVLACIWYGVQCYIGGHAVYIMLQAIWPSWNRDTIPDTIGNSPGVGRGTTTADFVSFFLFWLLSLPALWFPVYRIRHLFTLKSYLVPPAALAFVIWVAVRAGGLGPVFTRPGRLHGGALARVFLRAVTSCIANFSPVIINDADFSRFARRPADALLPQLLGIPPVFALTSLAGIFVASASADLYGNGEPVWDPLQLLEALLRDAYATGGSRGAGQRVGVFLVAAAFALAQLGTNIAANSVSAGTDMTALLPQLVNIRRGGYVCAAVGLAVCPWVLLRGSASFLTYISAYAVFLSATAGVIVADYYLVRRGYLNVPRLYTASADGPYFYGRCGISWRAYAAYIAGILVNIVGFAGAVGGDSIVVPQGAAYIYDINFLAGFVVSAAVYWILCRLWPVPETRDTWSEVRDCDDGEGEDNAGGGVLLPTTSIAAPAPTVVSRLPSRDEEKETAIIRSA